MEIIKPKKTIIIKKKPILSMIKNTKEKGDLYENYILAYLFEKYNQCNAWLWNNIPEDVMCDVGLIGNWNEHRKQRKANRINKLPDVGCDIFMIDSNLTNYLIQCKYYDVKNAVKMEDLAGWNSMLLDYPEMHGHLYYTSKLSENIKARKPNQRIEYFLKPFEPSITSTSTTTIEKPNEFNSIQKPIITLDYILNSSAENDILDIPITNNPFSNFTLKPYDYQLSAYNALKDKHRTVLQLPCGMGKTLIAIMLSSHYNKVVFISPLKAFCDQNLDRFKSQLGSEYACELVDSEGIRDCDNLADILGDTSRKHALFATYKSIDVIMKLFDLGMLDKTNTLFIIDEFHNIPFDDAFTYDSEYEDYLEYDEISMENEESDKHRDQEMESDSLYNDEDEDYLEGDSENDLEEDDPESIEKVRTPMYRLLHSDARIMFMSATPRLFEESDETADGMDIDSEIFGEVDYSFPMGKAIEEDYICDYMVYVPTMAIKQDSGIDDVIQELNVKDFDKEYNKEILVKARFIVRGCMGTGARKCIIYCLDQEECRVMMACIQDLCENYMAIDCWCDMITSDDSRNSREKKLEKFVQVKEKAFICSVQILNECVDIPECDSIFITYASKSRIRNIQRLCRANRKDKKNPNKIASVFLWCDEYNELASFMKHIKEYDSRFTYEQVKRVCSDDSSGSGVMKVSDNEQDKKDIDSIIVGYKGVSSWYEMLEKVKKFIDDNGKRPTETTNERLCRWLYKQIEYSKKKNRHMKIDKIYILWNEFITDEKYAKHFISNEEKWKTKLEEVKKFIDTNNARPTQRTNKDLYNWLSHQVKNFKKKIEIMKKYEIYNTFNMFINDARYKKYFNLDNVKNWKNRLDEVKQFIDTNNARPTPKSNKELHSWLSTQITSSKKRLYIMKDEKIYNLWNEFITDEKYAKHFISNEEEWKNKLKDVKQFIDKHNARPTQKTNSNLYAWLNTQIINSKKQTYIMHNKVIYNFYKEFINHDKYKKYFSKDNIREWNVKFEMVKQFIDKNNARPTPKTNKLLNRWLDTQIKNLKQKKEIMKNNDIHKSFSIFINNENYKKYFINNSEKWKNKLDEVKNFIDTNNVRPTPKTNKDLQSWLNTQLNNSKKRLDIMKNDEIYNLWNTFITDPNYSKYF